MKANGVIDDIDIVGVHGFPPDWTQGIDALMDRKDHVYAASAKTKLEGMLANVVPGSVKGAMHEKMARPLSEK
jgi:hypothetical protein